MRKITAGFIAALVLGWGLPCQAAADFNPIGFYLGAAVGESNVRSDGYSFGNAYGFSRSHAAWQLSVGIRPISPVGAEFDYIDFGNPSGAAGDYFNDANSRARASALFAVGYLPLPLPLIDVYGKAGLAHLQSDTTVFGPNSVFSQSRTNDEFAYGFGVQTHFANLGLRLEYTRIDASGGNPDILAVGVTWTF